MMQISGPHPSNPTHQAAFRALADPTRREILRGLTGGSRSIADIAGDFDMTRAAVKKHLTILSEGGLIRMQHRGRECINRLEPAGLAPLRDWLTFFDHYWEARLDALKSAIEGEQDDD